MKINTLITTIFLLINICNSQTILAQTQFGIRGGSNLANMSINFAGINVGTDINAGFFIGVLLDIPITEVLSIQPELHFVQKGFQQSSEAPGLNFSNSLRLNSLDLPIHVKYKHGINDKVSAFGLLGFNFGLGLFGNVESCDNGVFNSVDIEFGEENDFRRFDAGISIGGGVRLYEYVTLDIRYVLGINNIEPSDFDGFSTRTRGIQFGIGSYF